MLKWMGVGTVLGCTLLTLAMFGYVGITPTDASVKMAGWSANRAEQSLQESKVIAGFAIEETRLNSADVTKLEMRIDNLERIINELKNKKNE